MAQPITSAYPPPPPYYRLYQAQQAQRTGLGGGEGGSPLPSVSGPAPPPCPVGGSFSAFGVTYTVGGGGAAGRPLLPFVLGREGQCRGGGGGEQWGTSALTAPRPWDLPRQLGLPPKEEAPLALWAAAQLPARLKEGHAQLLAHFQALLRTLIRDPVGGMGEAVGRVEGEVRHLHHLLHQVRHAAARGELVRLLQQQVLEHQTLLERVRQATEQAEQLIAGPVAAGGEDVAMPIGADEAMQDVEQSDAQPGNAAMSLDKRARDEQELAFLESLASGILDSAAAT